MDNTEEQLIFELEKEYEKRISAEKALRECVEICDSYFKYGYTSETNSTRFGSIIMIVDKYFENNDISNTEKEEDNEDRRVQSKRC